MKKITLLLLTLFITTLTHSQDKLMVTAENGLLLRNEPSLQGKKIGTLYFGAEVTITKKTSHSQTTTDNEKEINGSWVKITFENYPIFISNAKYGYVFDGYLKNKSERIVEIKKEIAQHSQFDKLSLNTKITPFYLKGDFFGNKKDDSVILLKNSKGETKIGFIDKKTNKTYILGNADDPFKINNYNFGIFKKVKAGETLWSNYEDDFIEFKNVPESKKVKLKYNSLFLHALESCGGGFIYWKDGKFNWLQQE